jgi:hypothetical protein
MNMRLGKREDQVLGFHMIFNGTRLLYFRLYVPNGKTLYIMPPLCFPTKMKQW